MQQRHHFAKVILPGLVGNVLEWYDFAIYGYLAPIISHLFFPTNDKALSIIVTFAVFAAGFLMRPLGGMLFGYFGDRYGRKNSLAAAILLMTIPTTLMGCIPTYDDIGRAASLLMIVFRLLQGLAVGGEFTGSMVYIMEHAPHNKRGLYSGLTMMSPFVGLILGSAIAALVGLLSGESSFESNVWRAPFIFSIVLGFIGLYLRVKMPQSPVFDALKAQGKLITNPLKHCFSHHSVTMLKATALVILPSMAFYLSFVYLSTYLNQYHHIHLNNALLINSISMFGIIILIPLIGWLSDRIGRKPLLVVGAVGFFIFAIPLFKLLQTPTSLNILLVQFSFAVLISLSYATIPAVFAAMFPTEVRFTGLAFPYNIANAVFGGTAPLIAASIITASQNLTAPAWYVMVLAVITGTTALLCKETRNQSL